MRKESIVMIPGIIILSFSLSSCGIIDFSYAKVNKEEENIEKEFQNAKIEAETIAKEFPVSQNAIAKELENSSSQYSEESSRKAVDSINIDWNNNALTKAKSYDLHYQMPPEEMFDKLTRVDGFTEEQAHYAIEESKKYSNHSIPIEYKKVSDDAINVSESFFSSAPLIYDELVMRYGYSPEEAQYAIDNAKIDWNLNAVKSANHYYLVNGVPKENIYELLIEEKFTPEQAQYAIENLEEETIVHPE